MCRGLRREDIPLQNRTCKRRQTIFHDRIYLARENLVICWYLNNTRVRDKPNIQLLNTYMDRRASPLFGLLISGHKDNAIS